MNKLILTSGLVLISSFHSYSQTAQTQSRTSSSADAAASANGPVKSVNIASGTRFAAELQNTIDVRKAKVGDEVVLKTTQAIKSEGHTVVRKGARLIGRVTEVSERGEASEDSRVGIMFDRLESGALEVAIAARITSISKGQAHAARNEQSVVGIDSSGTASMSARTASGQRTSSTGSVVGGVTNSVGGVVNTASDVLGNTAAAVGSTVDSSTNVAGSATSSVGSSLAGIRISESSDGSASTGSVLSLRGKHLRLEKGTTLTMVLTQTASARTSQ